MVALLKWRVLFDCLCQALDTMNPLRKINNACSSFLFQFYGDTAETGQGGSGGSALTDGRHTHATVSCANERNWRR